MKNNGLFSLVLLAFLVAGLSSCAGRRLKAPNAKQYANMRYTYDHILSEYQAEFSLADSTDATVIRRCVLSHADETRRRLGGRSLISGKYQRYTSYPLLEYVADLRTAISDLERMSAQLTYPGSSELMYQVSQDMRKTAQQLCMFKGTLVADERYLQEQDKWDAAQVAKDRQATMDLLLVQSMNPQKVVHEIRMHEN